MEFLNLKALKLFHRSPGLDKEANPTLGFAMQQRSGSLKSG
jgi:hypothetical protein